MTPDDSPSRETLVAQIQALQTVVKRQQRLLDWIRASRFWKLRDSFFAFRRRFGGGIEPLPPVTADDLATEAAGFADAYQLFRIRERRSPAELDWLRRLVPSLAVRDTIEVIIDARGAPPSDLEATLASLQEQLYPYWHARVVAEPSDAFAFDPALAVCALDAGDCLEPDALLSLAIELYGGADVIYTDEDYMDAGGVPRRPALKPDWSPETEMTRDYVGRLCAIRGSVLAASGGLDATHGAAMWYDAVLRVTEGSDRVKHVARVLCHRRHAAPAASSPDAEAAVRRALTRRGEQAVVERAPAGIDIRYAVPENERVAVIIPTRDRADLLERCLASLFERTTHPTFETIIVDNGSRETATRKLFDRWRERAPDRFRVISDSEPFNFSRLNNRAVNETDAPYVLLLNNDTEVIAPEWMTAMLGQARRADIGAVGALLLYQDGTIQHAGVTLGGVLSLAGHVYRNQRPQELVASERLALDTNYLAVTGACLMVARSKYDEVGGLDEGFAVSYNDIDFCLKLHAAGYRTVMVPRARLYHYESKSRGRDDTKTKFDLAVSEREELRRRWPEQARRDPYYNANLTVDSEDFSIR
jgi:GT2 family glycosyltransferase